MPVQFLVAALGESVLTLEEAASLPRAKQTQVLRTAWESLRSLAVELRKREAALLGPQQSLCSLAPAFGPQAARWTLLDDDLLQLPWPEGWLLRLALDSGRPAIDHQAFTPLLDQLPPDLARAMTLRFGLDGAGPRKFSEIGAALGITASAARGRLNQALRELKRLYWQQLAEF